MSIVEMAKRNYGGFPTSIVFRELPVGLPIFPAQKRPEYVFLLEAEYDSS